MFLAIDFEGSHRNPRQGFPVQIGVAVMDLGGNVVDSDEWLIKCPVHYATGKPMREADAFALAISGITLERLESEGLTSADSCHRLEEFATRNKASSMPNVAYNTSYDTECYRDMLFNGGYFDKSSYPGIYRVYPEILSATWICAMVAARRSLASVLDKFSLDDVADYFGLVRSTDKHGALEDAIIAGKVYAQLREVAKAA